MSGFSEKWARTNGRTNGGESKGPSTPLRDQKSDNSRHQSEEKWENLMFKPF